MPDEAPATEQDTPTPEAPEAPELESEDTPDSPEPETPETDYQKRYDDLMPDYTRKSQLIAALSGQHGPEAQAEAAEVFGIEFEEPEAEEDDDDLNDPDSRIERLEKTLAEQQERGEAEQAYNEFLVDVNSGIEEIEAKISRELTDAETEFILARSESALRQGHELDVASAYESLDAIRKDERDRVVKSKRAPSAPLGTAGEEQLDTSTPEARKAAIESIAETHFQDS